MSNARGLILSFYVLTGRFNDNEVVAFNPGNLPPGLLASDDKVLQSRIFSYSDAQRYRWPPHPSPYTLTLCRFLKPPRLTWVTLLTRLYPSTANSLLH